MKVVFLLLLLLVSVMGVDQCGLEHCDECDVDGLCVTCRGFYEANDLGLCTFGVRVLVACILAGLLFFAVVLCCVLKIQEYRTKYTKRPSNIESIESASNVTDSELNSLSWQNSTDKIEDRTICSICDASGGTVKTQSNHVFHGDCLVWELRQLHHCPITGSQIDRIKIYCLKCLKSYLECPPEYYVDIKKKKSRVCDGCLRK